jgi:hypothetical protein
MPLTTDKTEGAASSLHPDVEDEMNEPARPSQRPVQSTKPAIQKWGRWGDRLAAMIADQRAIFADRMAKQALVSGSNRKPDAAE